MSDISASEKRLIAALARIDRSLSARPPVRPGADTAEVARLTAALQAREDELAALQAARSAEMATMAGIIEALEQALDQAAAGDPGEGGDEAEAEAASFGGAYGGGADDDGFGGAGSGDEGLADEGLADEGLGGGASGRGEDR